MPQFDPNALRTLLGGQAPTNMTRPRTQRELDLAGSLGGFEPSELELKMLQRDATEHFTTPSGEAPVGAVPWALGGGGSAVRGTSHIPGGSYTPSQDELRDMLMGGVKKQLMFGDIAHQQKMQQEIVPRRLEGQYDLAGKQIEGEYDVAAEGAGNEGAMQRVLAAQAGMSQRSAADNEAAMNRANVNNDSRRQTAEMIQRMITERGDSTGWLSGLLANLLGMGGGDEQPIPTETPEIEQPATPRRRILSVE